MAKAKKAKKKKARKAPAAKKAATKVTGGKATLLVPAKLKTELAQMAKAGKYANWKAYSIAVLAGGARE